MTVLQARFIVFAALSACAIASISGQALAQTADPIVPPETAVVSPGGVDTVSGQFRNETQDLAIGDQAAGGIGFSRVNETTRPFRSNWHIFIKENVQVTRDNGLMESWVSFAIESRALAKSYSPGANNTYFVNGLESDHGSKLERFSSGSNKYFLYTASDGATTRFEATSTGGNAHVLEVMQPNGVTHNFFYDNGGNSNDGDGSFKRLRRVTSNRGYQLILEYQASSNNENITKACVFSAAAINPPSGHVCPVGALASSYTYSGIHLASVTNNAGETATINTTTSSGGALLEQRYYLPGAAQPYMTNVYQPAEGSLFRVVASQTFADGRDFSYVYSDLDPGSEMPSLSLGTARVTSWVENGQNTTSLSWGIATEQYGSSPRTYFTPAPVTITDPIGRTTVNTFYGIPNGPFDKLKSRRLPSNRTEHFVYGTGGLVERRWEGPGITSLETTFTYDNSVPLNAFKPVTVTDPEGNVTSYTYSAVHGSVLSETSPAVGGINPQKRYSYAQKYAWLRQGGGYVQAATPIWLLMSEKYCRTSSANASGNCSAGSGDEVVTNYQYEAGNPTKGSTLDLLGISVTADGETLRTCYSYDDFGRKISETQPEGTGSTCP